MPACLHSLSVLRRSALSTSERVRVMRRTSVTGLVAISMAALAAVSVLALVLGSAHVPWLDAIGFLWAEISGGTVVVADAPNYSIVIASSLPRVLLAILVGAGLSLVGLVVHGDGARSVMFWLLGSLSAATWQMVPLAAVVTAVGVAAIAVAAQRLNALSMGDEVSAGLGLDASRFRLILFVIAASMTGCYVSICGAVGFVGLVVPHVARILVGADHERLIVVTPILGAVFLVTADLLSRTTVPPQELPLGAITAAVGVPAFVLLMRRRGTLMGDG